jgi:hypothetical protein
MGLDARLKDASGRTALDVAADTEHEKILEYFRETGAMIKETTDPGFRDCGAYRATGEV